ncbi:ankyrin repeat and protein kinase domain-containing protein 1-like [Gigantopelta aegis]|uniref:ankyrin repeat and protein kinase domain-containing protein 1-like n=1 Tax=Gigantopelta aegis TaxID=1735272 RepID=UPI001B88C9F4|nr:ankyrin repeat and protein kinase domain-containing protein 1-like [Gigantopelta aegis]
MDELVNEGVETIVDIEHGWNDPPQFSYHGSTSKKAISFTKRPTYPADTVPSDSTGRSTLDSSEPPPVVPHLPQTTPINLDKSIVNEFLCGDVLQTEVKQYLEELDSFEKSAELQDIKTAFEEALLPKQEATETTCKVIIKSTKRLKKMTIKNFKKLFFFLFGEVVYAHITILPGSIFLEFLVPRSQIQSLVLIAAEKVELMYQVGIFEMIVDGKLIFKKEEDTTITFEQSLLQAAQTGHNNDATLLLELRADIDYQNEEGQTALMLATNGEHENVVQTLISAGAKVDIQDNDGDTALMIACKNNSCSMVDLLLQAKANPDIQRQDVVKLLLKENVNPNHQRQRDGVTALILASEKGHHQVVELLLKENADSNLQKEDGWTALMSASQNGHHQVVELLLNGNADPNLQTQNWMDCFDVCQCKWTLPSRQASTRRKTSTIIIKDDKMV